jgi:hypothetical protein
MAPPSESETTKTSDTTGALSGVALWDKPRPPNWEAKWDVVVDEFLRRYSSEDDQKEWNKLKDRAIDICKQRLKEKKLLANVTGRVKEADSLRERLYQFAPS